MPSGVDPDSRLRSPSVRVSPCSLWFLPRLCGDVLVPRLRYRPHLLMLFGDACVASSRCCRPAVSSVAVLGRCGLHPGGEAVGHPVVARTRRLACGCLRRTAGTAGMRNRTHVALPGCIEHVFFSLSLPLAALAGGDLNAKLGVLPA